MNVTEPGFNITFTSNTENILQSNLTTTSIPAPVSHPPVPSPDYDPQFTIMVVLGLTLLLAGVAAFLAVCRPSQQDGDSEGSCGAGESWTPGRSQSSEPQLKVWKRLGSYRRSYNFSFRRPPHRRPNESTRVSQSLSRQMPQPEAGADPHLTMPCLFDYVTEI